MVETLAEERNVGQGSHHDEKRGRLYAGESQEVVGDSDSETGEKHGGVDQTGWICLVVVVQGVERLHLESEHTVVGSVANVTQRKEADEIGEKEARAAALAGMRDKHVVEVVVIPLPVARELAQHDDERHASRQHAHHFRENGLHLDVPSVVHPATLLVSGFTHVSIGEEGGVDHFGFVVLSDVLLTPDNVLHDNCLPDGFVLE